jgi:hypothetical protein
MSTPVWDDEGNVLVSVSARKRPIRLRRQIKGRAVGAQDRGGQ